MVPTNFARRKWAGEFVGKLVAAHPNIFPRRVSVKIGKA